MAKKTPSIISFELAIAQPKAIPIGPVPENMAIIIIERLVLVSFFEKFIPFANDKNIKTKNQLNINYQY